MLERAKSGDAICQLLVGIDYLQGTPNVKKDERKAVEWFRKSAEQGCVEAELFMGQCFHDGLGVDTDFAEAARWFRMAAKSRPSAARSPMTIPDAQFRLGLLLVRGAEGVEANKEEGAEWLGRSAARNYPDAQFCYGFCLLEGEGVKKDEKAGASMTLLAAENGHTGAQTAIGGCYEQGIGVEMSAANAIEWYQKAAEGGDETAKGRAEALSAEMAALKESMAAFVPKGGTTKETGETPSDEWLTKAIMLPGGVSVEMVRTPAGYWMGRCEVSRAVWNAIGGAAQADADGKSPATGGDGSLPVAGVSYDDCMAFIEKLNALPEVTRRGLIFRLPTEEEWKESAKGGLGCDYGRLSNGEEAKAEDIGWVGENSDGEPHPCGLKLPNAWGLHDMIGNVSEWTQTPQSEHNGVAISYWLCGGTWGAGAWENKVDERAMEFRNKRWIGAGMRLCADGDAIAEIPVSDAMRIRADGNAPFPIVDVKALFKAPSLVPPGGKVTIHLPKGASLEMTVVSNDFWMAKFETTQAQWEALMPANPSVSKGASLPVENVSAEDVEEFLIRLNVRPEVFALGMEFDIPWREEWLCCALAGGKDRQPRMAQLDLVPEGPEAGLLEYAWFEDNSGGRTHPVGLKNPNAWGFHDMLGNVAEYVRTPAAWGSGGNFSTPQWLLSHKWTDDYGASSGALGFRICARPRKYVDSADTVQSNRKFKSSAEDAVKSVLADMAEIPGQLFFMGRHEITQKQWVGMMGENPSLFIGDNLPVEGLQHGNCLAFIAKLNDMPIVKDAGLSFRLPTAQEWDIACRAGSKGPYGNVFGRKMGDPLIMGWTGCGYLGPYSGDYAMQERVEKEMDIAAEIAPDSPIIVWNRRMMEARLRAMRKGTHPVGLKLPNVWGLFDMHGNVAEWTSSKDSSEEVEAFFVRGGSIEDIDSACAAGDNRSTQGDGLPPSEVYRNCIGLRLLVERRRE
ncbi:MAG: SUMF1/EgtB/PvdO family nonheme iron enzyme [Kiritimatiellae bacterium]|nr:SUMF1/EgtB/PvdO family nonheme iron enzyme [Kiritimatiellia bacterium]